MSKQTKRVPPAGLETKNLADHLEADDKTAPVAAADPAPAKAEGVQVRLVHHYTHEGDPHLPGETITVPEQVASALVAGHYAVRA